MAAWFTVQKSRPSVRPTAAVLKMAAILTDTQSNRPLSVLGRWRHKFNQELLKFSRLHTRLDSDLGNSEATSMGEKKLVCYEIKQEAQLKQGLADRTAKTAVSAAI